jgi:hypothetical protein
MNTVPMQQQNHVPPQGMPIITPEMRLAQPPKINVCVFGKAKMGKTTLVKTLPPHEVLFADAEAGTIAFGGLPIDVFPLRTWQDCKDLAVFLAGPQPVTDPNADYGPAHFNYVCSRWGDPRQVLAKYNYVFVDSITLASQFSFKDACANPLALSPKNGKLDLRGAYGIHGKQMVEWLWVLQRQPKSIIVVGGMEEKTDDFGKKSWVPLIDGGMAANNLPYVWDVVLTLTSFDSETGPYRALVTQATNPYGFPAGDRTGCLSPIEPPNLGVIVEKVRSNVRNEFLQTSIPQQG